MTDAPTDRPLGPADLAAVVALIAACDLAVVGFRDFTDDEVRCGCTSRRNAAVLEIDAWAKRTPATR